jgi:hypothetical protein
MSSSKDKVLDKSLKGGWGRAIVEAETQIQQYRKKIYELTNSVTIFRAKIASGEPWLGEQETAATRN